MKKSLKIALFLLIFTPVFAFSQTTNKNEVVFAVFGNQLKAENNGQPLPANSYISAGQSLREKTSFSIGYRANFRKKRWNWSAGMQAKNTIIDVVCDCSQWPSENNPNSPGTYLRDPALDDRIKTSVLFFEFPILANLFLNKKQNLSFDFGVLPAFSFVKKVQSKTFTPSNWDGTKVSFSQKNMSNRVGLGFYASEKLHFHLFLSHDFKPFKGEQTSIAVRRNSIGLELGFCF